MCLLRVCVTSACRTSQNYSHQRGYYRWPYEGRRRRGDEFRMKQAFERVVIVGDLKMAFSEFRLKRSKKNSLPSLSLHVRSLSLSLYPQKCPERTLDLSPAIKNPPNSLKRERERDLKIGIIFIEGGERETSCLIIPQKPPFSEILKRYQKLAFWKCAIIIDRRLLSSPHTYRYIICFISCGSLKEKPTLGFADFIALAQKIAVYYCLPASANSLALLSHNSISFGL